MIQKFVNYLKDSLVFMEEIKKKAPHSFDYNKNSMWTKGESNFLNNVLNSDNRFFNHIGSLSYKTFLPINYDFKSSLRDVFFTLANYNYLKNNNKNYDGLYTDLNSPFFTFDNLKLNSNIYYIEVFDKIENILNKLQKDSNKNLKILEIGPGKGQLANIIFNRIKNVKYVLMDIPPMHSIAPYFLYKHGKKICSYKHFCSLDKSIDEAFKNFDVLLLPPYEKEIVSSYNFDISINCRSLCEMEFEEAKKYINLIDNNSKYFFSINTKEKSSSSEWEKFGIMDLTKYFKNMNLAETGYTFGDTIMLKNPHFIFSILKK
jgi:putative sugar O-methyltransferase